jgi:hypothetical protein
MGHSYDTPARENVTMDERDWLTPQFEAHRSHLSRFTSTWTKRLG